MNNLDIYMIVVYNKASFGEKECKYLTGYKHTIRRG